MAADRKYYSELETRDPEAREKALMAALAKQVAHAKASSAHFGAALKDVDAAGAASRAALAKLPVTRKGDLKELQSKSKPFGGLNGWPLAKMGHVFQSPGPIYEPGGRGEDNWGFASALWAAGARPGMLVHNTFSYHLVPAGLMVEGGAHAIGGPVFPGGVGNTELQVQAINDLRPAVYAGTPSFLKILLEKGRELKLDTSSLKHASVGAEALPPSLRAAIKELGVFAIQSYGTADVGVIAYETEALEGMVIDENVIVEIVRPGTGEPVAEGDVGEVVVTTFNAAYPLIRFGTGDLSAVLAGRSPCGRTNTRIKGWMGRADQTTKIRGMFVHPTQAGDVAKRHPEVSKIRIEVTTKNNLDDMVVKCEAKQAGEALAAAIAESVVAVCKVRGRVELVAPGSLPDDGKVIADLRTYT